MKPELLLNIISKETTPFYVYDLSSIQRNICTLYGALPHGVRLLYSVKANPSLGLLSYIGKSVDGFEVASEGELYLSLRAGIAPERVFFIGPGKTRAEIEYAIDQRIGAIVVESVAELTLVNEMAAVRRSVMPVLIRVNPMSGIANARFKMGGEAKPFGIDEETIVEAALHASTLSNIRFEGIQVYYGTEILSAESIAQAFGNIWQIVDNMERELGRELAKVDLGGGFGVPYFKGDSELDLGRLSEYLSEVWQGFSYLRLQDKQVFVESGRFLVAESGYFVSQIQYKKRSRDKTFLILDGGSNNHSSAAGIGRFVRNNFPVSILGKPCDGEMETVTIVGPLCTPTDVIATDVLLPVANPGDYVVVHRSGAYGFSASMNAFLSHVAPAEYAVSEDSYAVLRERGQKEDYGKDERMLLNL